MSIFIGPAISLFFFSLFLFVSLKTHLASMLIHLEILGLYILSVLLLNFNNTSTNLILLFFILCTIVSEAALGLSFLVMSSRVSRSELESFKIN